MSALSLGFRAAGLLPAEALLPMTILVMLAKSETGADRLIVKNN